MDVGFPSVYLAVLSILGLYGLYVIGDLIRYRYASYKAGCSVPVRYRHRDPVFGLDLFLKRITAMKEGVWLDVDPYLFSNYGKTVLTNAWGKKQYVTMDPKNIQTIVATEVDKFGAAPMNSAVARPFLGEGVLSTDGARWKYSRQLINPIFSRAQVSEFSTFEIHVRRMIDRIPRDGSTVDLQPLCKSLYLDSTTEFIFGKSANSQSPELSNAIAGRLSEIFDDALRGMLTKFLFGKLSFLVRSEKTWLRQCAEVHAIIDNYIEEDIEERKKVAVESPDTPYKYVLLKELFKAIDDKLFIRNKLMNIFFPVQDLAVVLTNNTVFLLNVISETLRIFSPVVRSWKTCLSPAVLPHGGGPLGNDPILLEPGDQVDMAFGSMHMDADIWGADAHEFKPDRWQGRRQDWGYIPFFGGRRICPAQQHVLTNAAYILARLMQEFSACENRDPCYEYLSTQVFTKQSRNGSKVSFVPV
ncbi:hypothetical protein NHQ30_005453 [Ciborinia camelliae]|nr:hypothetical protein NHQ30_005453 [Ciborinia camelliae]